tara:strand:+ start:4214 stop:5251 length:1038 start_codon:yes stop_codon:yes gene_type:complete
MFLFILLIIIIILIRHIKKETFINYKSIVVTPTITTFKDINFILPENKFLQNILSKKLQEIYPINKIINYNIKTALDLMNKKPNYILIAPESIQYINSLNKKNIRFISSLGIEKITLISPRKNGINSWNDLTNKKIGVVKKSTSYYTLRYIQSKLLINFKIVSIVDREQQIEKDFKQNKYDAFFMLTAHPNELLRGINKNLPLKFIGTEGIKKEESDIIFTNLNPSTIDLTHYDIYNEQPKTLMSKLDILVNKDFDEKSGYNFIETIFKNLMNIKTVGINKYKLHMRDFNPEFIYLNNNNYKLHKGVKKFYKNIGLITNNSERSCIYKIGIGKCNLQKINHFRLL